MYCCSYRICILPGPLQGSFAAAKRQKLISTPRPRVHSQRNSMRYIAAAYRFKIVGALRVILCVVRIRRGLSSGAHDPGECSITQMAYCASLCFSRGLLQNHTQSQTNPVGTLEKTVAHARGVCNEGCCARDCPYPSILHTLQGSSQKALQHSNALML